MNRLYAINIYNNNKDKVNLISCDNADTANCVYIILEQLRKNGLLKVSEVELTIA